ncbi:MAG: PAS domain S-box protein [Candidatus Odinarchaeota archaeon]
MMQEKRLVTPPDEDILRILHVDDDSFFLELVKEILEDSYSDLQLDSLSTPGEVFQKLVENDYDTIVSDYQMSGLDGLELLEQLRKQGNEIPFIIFTGRGREEVAIRALNLGADYYLQKGSSGAVFAELHHFITSAVEKRRAEEKLRKSEEHLRNAQSIAHLGSWEWDIGTNTVELSEEMLAIFGLDQEEAVFRGIHDMVARIHPDDRMRVQEDLKVLEMATGGVKTNPVEYRIITPAGAVKWIRVDSRAVTGSSAELERITGYVLDITKRKKAEGGLRESERKFREMTDLLPETVYESDIRGDLTFLNQCGIDLTGYDLDDTGGDLNLLQLVAPEEHGKVKNDLQMLAKGAYLGYTEHSLVRKDGNRVPVLVHSVPIMQDGAITGLRGVIVDMTAKKAAETAIQERETRLREIIDLVPHYIYAKDMEGRHILVNKAVASSYGLSPEELTGKTYGDLVHHLDGGFLKERLMEQYRQFLAEDREVMESGETLFIPGETVTAINGERAVFQTTKIPFTSAGVPAVLGVSIDITRLKQSERALQESEQNYRELVEELMEGVVVEDINGTITFANPRAAEMTGYAVEELTGRHWSAIIHESVRNTVEEETAKRSRGISSTYETLVKTKEGCTVPVLVHATPRFSGKGVFQGVLAVFTDISALKRIEDQLKDEKRHYQALFEQSPLATAVYSPDGRLMHINPAFAELLPVTWTTVEKSLATYNIFQDGQLKAAGLVPTIRKAFAGETVVIPGTGYGSRNVDVARCTTLPVFWTRTCLYPVKDISGNVCEVVVISEDLLT